MSEEREEAIRSIMASGNGKTREQAEAFLDVLRSAFRRRGWVEGEPLSQEEIRERVDVFVSPSRDDRSDPS